MPEEMTPIFASGLVEQEFSTERWIEIPEPIREIYRLWRPAPLARAHRMEKALGTPGSLGMAVSEAIEDAVGGDNSRYALGSVLNHVMLHQTIIGQEAAAQLAMFGESGPDVVVGCADGGSNLAGLTFPSIGHSLTGEVLDDGASSSTLTSPSSAAGTQAAGTGVGGS